MAAEARNPQRKVPRAVIGSVILGTILYAALEIVFIGALNPVNLAHGWAHPIGTGDFGPYATLATGLGLGWLADLPRTVTRISSRGVPITSVIPAFIVGLICFLPFPSWRSLVSVVTSATVIMYAFAPITLLVLRKAEEVCCHLAPPHCGATEMIWLSELSSTVTRTIKLPERPAGFHTRVRQPAAGFDSSRI